jgi:hypothetical protein
MTPQEFINGLWSEVIDANLDTYHRLYENPQRPAPEIELFRSLPPEKRDVFFTIIRQVQVDTLATLLAILDGVSILKSQKGDFRIVYTEGAEDVISGSLSELFLGEVEERAK